MNAVVIQDLSLWNWMDLDWKKNIKMEINRIDYESYNTSSIKTNNVTLDLDDYNIIEINDTKYDYEKVALELSKEKLKETKEYETELNEYFTKKGFNRVALLYGKMIYANTTKSTPRDQLKQIRLKGVFIYNDTQKLYVQFWLE